MSTSGQKGHIRCSCGHLDSMHRTWGAKPHACRVESCPCEHMQPVAEAKLREEEAREEDAR